MSWEYVTLDKLGTISRGRSKHRPRTVVGATVAHLGKKHIDTIELLTGPDELYVPFEYLFQKRQLLLN